MKHIATWKDRKGQLHWTRGIVGRVYSAWWTLPDYITSNNPGPLVYCRRTRQRSSMHFTLGEALLAAFGGQP